MKSRIARIIVHPWFDYAALVAAIVVLVGFFSWRNEHFFSAETAAAIAQQKSDLLVVSVGMTLVLLVGEIDLSVGSVAALSGAVLGWLLVDGGLPLGAAVGGALLVGTGCGLCNGFVTVHWKLPSFIVTLGMFEVARGAAYLITGSQTKYLGSQLELLGMSIPGTDLSVMFLSAVGLVVAGELILRGTVFGRHLFAIGSNETAARLSGIHPGRLRLIVFGISGMLAGLGGVFQTAHLSMADPNAGTGMGLAAIAAVVIGGTSLNGGRGSVVGAFLGLAIVAILQTGLTQMSASDPVKRIVTGVVIVSAVIGDVYRRRLSERGARQ